jgi:hypothetical protein
LVAGLLFSRHFRYLWRTRTDCLHFITKYELGRKTYRFEYGRVLSRTLRLPGSTAFNLDIDDSINLSK